MDPHPIKIDISVGAYRDENVSIISLIIITEILIFFNKSKYSSNTNISIPLFYSFLFYYSHHHYIVLFFFFFISCPILYQ